ncbi:MAG: hypothetical protein K0M68_23360, partial [Acidovorax sp.]|nr:hypothetical protein [Acidovorax sp.]
MPQYVETFVDNCQQPVAWSQPLLFWLFGTFWPLARYGIDFIAIEIIALPRRPGVAHSSPPPPALFPLAFDHAR